METIDKVRQMIADGVLTQEDAVRYFPELAESEDEKVRKEILDCFVSMKQQGCFPSKHKDRYDTWIAWLEKQGKPKYLDASNCEPWSDEQTRRNLINFLKSLGATEIPQASYNRYIAYLEKQGEQKPKFKVGDVIRRKSDGLEAKVVNLVNGSAEAQCSDWTQFILDEQWELVEQEPTEWSEKDEKQRRQIERIASNNGCTKKLQEQIHNWFESLKKRCIPQNTWKPSEEQMKALEFYIEKGFIDKEGCFGKCIIKLYEQLKKLMEE